MPAHLAMMLTGHSLPTVIIYIAANNACGQARQWHRALGLLATMQTAYLLPKVTTYNDTISACESGQRGASRIRPQAAT